MAVFNQSLGVCASPPLLRLHPWVMKVKWACPTSSSGFSTHLLLILISTPAIYLHYLHRFFSHSMLGRCLNSVGKNTVLSLWFPALQHRVSTIQPTWKQRLSVKLLPTRELVGQHETFFKEALKVDQPTSPSTALSSGAQVVTLSPIDPNPPAQPVPLPLRSMCLPQNIMTATWVARHFLFSAHLFSNTSSVCILPITPGEPVINLLTGKALELANALWERQSVGYASYSAFTQEFRRVFDHPILGRDSASRLFTLQQGTANVAKYLIKK